MKTLLKFTKNVMTAFVFAGLAMSCSSGLQQLNKGNFDEAIENSVERLQQKPEHTKALSVLKEAYPLAVADHKRAIRIYENLQEPFRWERALAEYQQLNRIYEMVSRSPVAMRAVGLPQNYAHEAEIARQLAADERYQAGISALNHKENRLAAKDAVGQFQRVNELIPNYKGANQKVEEAFQYATHRVLIEPIYDVFRLSQNEYDVLQAAFNREIFRSKAPSPFVRYYTTNMIRQESLPQNDVVKFALVSLSSPSINVNKTVEHFTKQVKTGTKKLNDSTQTDVFETVKGTITTFQKSIVINGTMEMRVLDYKSNNLITEEARNETFTWNDTWKTFEGDPRALDGKTCPPRHASGSIEPTPYTLFSSLSNQFANYYQERLKKAYRNM
ncbi:MAG: hypothetical protein MUF58_08555 [Arcicella sp.]|nr:hypothetical protein [Arcicella sp.]